MFKIITWDLSIFGRICVKKSFRFHGDIQLSCWKFLLNHLASWWKFCSKLWKNMKFPTLRKIYKFRNFDFSKWNLEFLISWWIIFIFWHALMNCDLWHLILTKKSKFDFSVYRQNFDQLTEKFTCQSNAIEVFWACWIGQDDAIESLSPCLNPIFHLARSKVRNCLCTVKTLKMTILPFWWSDQISCGVVVQTWSNGSCELIMLMWVKIHEVWL